MSPRVHSFIAVLAVFFASAAHAGPIALTNAGFEDPDIGNGASSTWPTQMPAGWTQNLASGATLIDPTSGLQAYEGEQYMLFQIDNRFGNQYIGQTTSEALTAGNTYTASVWLGARGNGDSWGSIGIVAGSTLLSWDRLIIPGKQSTDVSYSEWYQLSVDFTATGSDANLGELLSVRLWRDQGMGSAAFDAVGFSITPSSVPEPGSMLLLASGLLLAVRRRRRET